MSTLQKVSKGIIKYTRNAEEIFKGVNGVFAVYKPAGKPRMKVREILINHMCRDLNHMEVRPPENFVRIEGETNKPMNVTVEPSYADNTLVVGPRYQPQDVKLAFAHDMSMDMSGIMLVGINRRGTWMINKIKESVPTRFFKIKGVLGQATDNFFIDGKILEKTTWKHVRRHHVDKICASMQSSHQRKMFEVCGLDIQSQEAYELAVQGPIRPAEDKIPVVYAIKCIDFKPPDFTLEVICINEDDLFIKSLVHTLGHEVRSAATCTQVQCYQYGVFTLDYALLKREWDLENIAKNMNRCRRILGKHRYIFKQEDPILREYFDDVNPEAFTIENSENM